MPLTLPAKRNRISIAIIAMLFTTLLLIQLPVWAEPLPTEEEEMHSLLEKVYPSSKLIRKLSELESKNSSFC